jgi:hypothetical protein
MARKNSRIYRTIAFAAVLGGVAISQSGCLLLAVGAGTGVGVAYVAGKSEAIVDGNPKQVAAATELAIKDLEMTLVSKDASLADSRVIARTARDVKYEIVAKAEGAKTSHVYIRVGVFGDDAMQYQMLDKIKAHLPEAVAANPESAAPTTQTADAKN